jgi:hypothetical protein
MLDSDQAFYVFPKTYALSAQGGFLPYSTDRTTIILREFYLFIILEARSLVIIGVLKPSYVTGMPLTSLY